LGCANTATCRPSRAYHLSVKAGYRYVLTPNAVYVSDRKSPRNTATEEKYEQFEQEQQRIVAEKVARKNDYQSLANSNSINSSNELIRLISEFQNNDPQNLIPQARIRTQSLLAQEKLQLYRSEFEYATTSDSLKHFIEKYRNDDPDEYVQKSQQMLPSIEAKEAAEARAQDKQRKAEIERARIAEEEKSKRLNKWRSSLQVGDDTNCGPVLEVKRGLIKVSFPVQNYGDEHWIKTNLIQMPGTGCKFVNGMYKPS
jgi:L-2-hydroxyglutarate oxidase LhgO